MILLRLDDQRSRQPGSGPPRRCVLSIVFLAAAAGSACATPAPGPQAGAQASPTPAETADPALEIALRAARALGGREAIEATRTVVLEGEGDEYTLGQGPTPDGELPRFQATGLRREVDFVRRRWRQEQVFIAPASAGWAGPLQFVWALDGDIAFDMVAGGDATTPASQDARDRRAQRLHYPLSILRAALDPAARLANPRRSRGRDLVDVRTAEDGVFTLAVDSSTGLPVAVASMTNSANLGDIWMETEFAEYRAAGALKLPTRLTSRMDGTTIFVLRVARNLVNAPVGDLAAPASLGPAGEVPPVTVDDVARGVWLLHGEYHNSLLVEFADHLTMIEAPLDDAHTLPLIARARQLRPEKPVTHLIVTHHHFDHSGGVRAAVAEGLTIIAHEKVKSFIEDMVSRPHTIVPDELARRPRPLALQTIPDRAVLRDSYRTMELHSVASPHAEEMLVAYLPGERLLVEVDLFTPGPKGANPPTPQPHAQGLLELVESQKLAVDRVVPLHGGIVPFADLVAVGRKSTQARAP
jgi:glyoxylase-like metal-dependent hydrolase (beta-lactamase superfamily II)